MSPSVCTCTPARPAPTAAELNAAIRALAAGARWTPVELAEYRRLVVAERAAVARERQAAA